MEDFKQRPMRMPHEPSSSGQHRDREREYREKKDRERLGHHVKPPLPNAPSSKHPPPQHGHHSHTPPVDPKLNKHTRPPSLGHASGVRVEPRDILRDAARDIGLRDFKEPSRDINQQVRTSDKRDYMHQRPEVKPSVPDSNSVSMSYNADKRVDPTKPRPVDPKLQVRRREDVKQYNKLESDIKKHLSAVIQDKNAYLHKPINTSQKVKSPFASEMPKSVPNQSIGPPSANATTISKSEVRLEPHNGSSNGSAYNLPIIEEVKAKPDTFVQEEPVIVLSNPVKKPSLFSPEKSPPAQKKPRTKTPPNSGKKLNEAPLAPALSSPPAFELPQTSANTKRNRTSSTNSEPELRPVMKKIDQVQGFETLMRDSSIGIKLHQVPDIITPIPDVKQEKVSIQNSIAKELKPPDLIPPFSTSNNSQPIMNGIETNPSLISSLLKEVPTVPHLPAVAANAVVVTEPSKEKEQYHKEHKKNKKEKHKHKDKEKNREEKERKKKHKDKDREKHKHKHEKHETESEEVPAQPIKITIPKDKIQSTSETPIPSLGLKIKIPKDRIKTDGIGETSTVGGGLKIKISKDVISNFNSDNNSKKRERERTSPTTGAPPNKISKSNHNRISDTKVAKSSYNKVSKLNNNVGDPTMHNVQTSVYNGINHLTHPGYTNQTAPHNYFYNYPPPNMQLPMVPAGMSVPPPYIYQQYYPTSYMYPSADMYTASNASLGGEAPPPLPQDPPPNNPPPPPPDC